MSTATAATPSSKLPGAVVAVALAAAALAISAAIGTALFHMEHSPVSPVMLAVLLGALLAQSAPLRERLAAGASFASTTILRFGIVLVGLKLSFGSTLEIAARALPIVAACLALAAVVALLLARAFGLRREFGLLIAIGTSICGCTAVLASAPLVRARSEEVGYTVSCIVLVGLAGMLLYPWLAHATFGADPTAAGLFLGTSIHDTSQVIGAALLYSQTFGEPQALAAATVAKLLRNLTLVLLLPTLAILAQRAVLEAQSPAERRGLEAEEARRAEVLGPDAPVGGSWLGGAFSQVRKAVPGFVLAFLALVVLRNFGDMAAGAGSIPAEAWKSLLGAAAKLSEYALTAGMAGVGLTLTVKTLTPLGAKPLVVAVATALVVMAASWTLTGLLAG